MFNDSGAVQAVDVVGGPTSEENKNISVRTLCVCVCYGIGIPMYSISVCLPAYACQFICRLPSTSVTITLLTVAFTCHR